MTTITLEQLGEWIDFFRGAEVTIGNGSKVWILAGAYLRGGEPVCVIKRNVPGPHEWSIPTPIKRTLNISKVRLVSG